MDSHLSKLIAAVKSVVEKEFELTTAPYSGDIPTLIQHLSKMDVDDLHDGVYDKAKYLYAIACANEAEQEVSKELFVQMAFKLAQDLIWKNKKDACTMIIFAIDEYISNQEDRSPYAVVHTMAIAEKLNMECRNIQIRAKTHEEAKEQFETHEVNTLIEMTRNAYQNCNPDDYASKLYYMRILAPVYAEINVPELKNLYRLYDEMIESLDECTPILAQEFLLTGSQFCSLVANQIRARKIASSAQKSFITDIVEQLLKFEVSKNPSWVSILLSLVTVYNYEYNFAEADHHIDEGKEIIKNFPGMEYNEIPLFLQVLEAERYYLEAMGTQDFSIRVWAAGKAITLYEIIIHLNEQVYFITSLSSIKDKITELKGLLASLRVEDQTQIELELIALSEFSSELRHSRIDPDDRVLTVAEFNTLPAAGSINPYKLRAAQGGINSKFRDGKTLSDLKVRLVDAPQYTHQVPPIEIGIYKDKVYSFDTRRLIVHMQAREENPAVTIRYKKIDGEYLQDRIAAIFSPRPWNGFVTAIRYGGKGDESTPYITPPAREQLTNTVEKNFKSYPTTRVDGDDNNGFPINKFKAKKIHTYLAKQSQNSSLAKQIITEAATIQNNSGSLAAYDYYIQQTNNLRKYANTVVESNKAVEDGSYKNTI